MESVMYPTPFDPQIDLRPIPFDPLPCQLALKLKEAGLTWRRHEECFVRGPVGPSRAGQEGEGKKGGRIATDTG